MFTFRKNDLYHLKALKKRCVRYISSVLIFQTHFDLLLFKDVKKTPKLEPEDWTLG